MAEQEFSEFVNRKVATSGNESGEDIDWRKKRCEWLEQLGALFNDMENFLRPYTQSGEIEIERIPLQLNEEYLGKYDVEMLTFKIGREKIVAKPIGAQLIGSKGRVDLSGPRKILKIVLLAAGGPSFSTRIKIGAVPEESSSPIVRGDVNEEGWYIQTSPPDSIVVKFCKDSFQDAIMDVSGG